MATTAVFAEILVIGLQVVVWLALAVLAITGPLAALYIAVRTDEGLVWTLVPLVSVLALIPITYFVGVRIQDAWVGRLKDAYAIVRTGSA